MNIKLIIAFVIIGTFVLAILIEVGKRLMKDPDAREGTLFVLALAVVLSMIVWACITINEYYHFI